MKTVLRELRFLGSTGAIQASPSALGSHRDAALGRRSGWEQLEEVAKPRRPLLEHCAAQRAERTARACARGSSPAFGVPVTKSEASALCARQDQVRKHNLTLGGWLHANPLLPRVPRGKPHVLLVLCCTWELARERSCCHQVRGARAGLSGTKKEQESDARGFYEPTSPHHSPRSAGSSPEFFGPSGCFVGVGVCFSSSA